MGRALGWRPLRWLGVISYGVSLWHWPVYVVLDEARTGLGGWTLVAARIAVTLVIARFSYVLLEEPIRRGALRAPQLRVVVPATATVVVAALLVGTVGKEAPAAPPEEALVAAAETVAGWRRLMVVGNSVGDLLAPGFDALRSDPPLTVANRALPACILPLGATGLRFTVGTLPVVDCASNWSTDVVTFDPDLVLAMGNIGDSEIEVDGEWIHACMPTYDEQYERELRAAVDVLSAGAATVALSTSAHASITFRPVVDAERNDCVNDIIRSVASADDQTVLVDLARWICPDGPRCRKEIDGVELRPDGVHYRDASAVLVADWIMGQVSANVEP